MLGIITATKNRSEFVIRGLHYYANVGCPYTIYIGDSSEDEHRERVLAVIDELKGKLNVVHQYYPNTSGHIAMKKLAESVIEKYVAWTGDDDFLIPLSLQKCVEFLETNHDYVTAQGKAFVLKLDRSGAYGNIQSCGPYSLLDNQYETPSERFLHFMENYWVTEFSVHRTKDFVEDSDSMEKMLELGFSEVLRCSMSNIQGKSKKLDCLYLVRQVHDQRYTLPRLLDEITSPGWQPTYQAVNERLTKALVDKEGISHELASETVKKGLYKRLTLSMRQYMREAKPTRPTLRQIVKRIPGSQRIYNKFKTSYVDTLLSSYPQEFRPIYNILTVSEKSKH